MLTAVEVKNAQPREKPYRLFDARGLYLEVHPGGARYWRLKYRYAGKEKRLSLGVFPEVGLAEARSRADSHRTTLRDGADPSAKRRAERIAQRVRAANTFEAVAEEWHTSRSKGWADRHADRVLWRLKRHVFPWLGSRPIAEITAPEILDVLRRIEAKGHGETAHRIRAICGQVFRYAIVTDRATRDPSGDLRGALGPKNPTHYATITEPVGIGALMRAIDGYTGTPEVCAALRLAPLVFVRPGELRRAEWSEIDLDAAEWRIPGTKMKSKRPHIVPLSRQAVAVLRDLQPLTGGGPGPFVFPSIRGGKRPMSENTVNAALRKLGYSKEEMTGHGFRAMASTRLHELGWRTEVIERQLAHLEPNEVKAAYNHAKYLDERRTMMQAWADYLDTLRHGNS